MKHIKPKFLSAIGLEQDLHTKLMSPEAGNKISEFQIRDLKSSDDFFASMVTLDRQLVQAFKYRTKDGVFLIPEPNPIVIYFSNAQQHLQPMILEKEKLFDHLNQETKYISELQRYFSNYYGFSTNLIISLFNSLEAFINSLIPEEYVYKRKTNKNVEHYNRDDIQRHLQLEEKMLKVVPEAINQKPFHSNNSHKHEFILKKFKTFRDDIVHSKVDHERKPNYYEKLFVASLQFDYTRALNDVKDYINYYHPDLIEECDCGGQH